MIVLLRTVMPSCRRGYWTMFNSQIGQSPCHPRVSTIPGDGAKFRVYHEGKSLPYYRWIRLLVSVINLYLRWGAGMLTRFDAAIMRYLPYHNCRIELRQVTTANPTTYHSTSILDGRQSSILITWPPRNDHRHLPPKHDRLVD